jgi:hypothetical protein
MLRMTRTGDLVDVIAVSDRVIVAVPKHERIAIVAPASLDHLEQSPEGEGASERPADRCPAHRCAAASSREQRSDGARGIERSDWVADRAHGLHPAVVDECGLAAALAGLASRAPLPVELQVAPRRAPRPVEAAFYFTIAEALTNVFKHAHATRARVMVAVDDGALIAEVVDDGIGGASVAAGSGLRGLTDRLDMVGGALTVDNPRGGPTTIRACAPLRRLAAPDTREDVSRAAEHGVAAPS